MEVIVQALFWWSELWSAKDNWVGRDILKIKYQFIDIVQWKISTDLKRLPQSHVDVNVSSEMLIWWIKLWCVKDNWIGRDNLKRIWFHWHYPIKHFNWLKAFTSVGGDCVDRNGPDITDHVQNKKKNGLVASRPWRKEKWTGCIQTIEKRKMERKNG